MDHRWRLSGTGINLAIVLFCPYICPFFGEASFEGWYYGEGGGRVRVYILGIISQQYQCCFSVHGVAGFRRFTLLCFCMATMY